MILNEHGHRRTANQLAKELVYEHGASVLADWHDKISLVYYDRFTPREEQLVKNALINQVARVEKLLGNPDPGDDA